MREIVLDTETTGLSPAEGHRIVEIGCVELRNHVATGKIYHTYLNPERDMPAGAAAVHGLTGAFLTDKPLFAEAAGAFLDFIADAPLVIHNAPFDMAFLNAELTRLGFAALPKGRAIDTLEIARRKFFGAPASLDALCKRFSIDLSGRTLHGALLDAQLLAEVYLELCGGRQTNFDIAAPAKTASRTVSNQVPAPTADRAEVAGKYLPPRAHAPTEEEYAAHEKFLAQIKNPLWRRG